MIFLQLFREVRIMKFLDHPNIGKDVWFHLFWVCHFLISLCVLFLPVNNKFLLLSLPRSEVVWGYRNRQNPVPCNGVCKWRYGWCCLNNSVNRKIMIVACFVLVTFNEGTPFQGFSHHHHCNQTITNCLFVIYIRKKDET